MWDVRSACGGATSGIGCTAVINPWDGVALPVDGQAMQLQSARGPYVSAVRCEKA